MELTLTKTRNYKLEPYGKFCFKWHEPKTGFIKAHQILISELTMKHDTGMPVTKEQEKALIKEMKKFKTDVFTDGDKFYTLSNNDLVEIYHEKLIRYKTDPTFKSFVDDVQRFF